ncbi:MAG: phage tail tape measure protein [Clostridiales bacterium]|nr:phage tail tape measure protein [Clostridiales bacterium]
MAGQRLETIITIGGSVDNSFGTIGSALLGLGSTIDGISQKIIGFGKDSVGEFIGYDDLMRQVQAVGEFSGEEMRTLDELNSRIGTTSTYSKKQAAEAEVFMGQLGLTTEEIKTLIPSVLGLAMAGNLGLADSVDYLYSSLMSLREELGFAGTLTDQMAKTAAIGSTDIDTLGDSMTRLGSGLNLFKGGSAEVLTILSAMAQFGKDMRGEEGGTALRNFALNLVAPMGEKKAVIAALENLGMTQSELDAYLEEEGIDLTAAAGAIKELGLNVFDESGNLRNMLDIISDLRTALAGLGSDDMRASVLGQIFGKRGYITASNLISVSDEQYKISMADIIDSEGFAAQMAATMQGGLGGAIRKLEAAWDSFKIKVGDSLDDVLQPAADWLHGIVVELNNMDKSQLDALVSAATTIGVAGPALLLAGTAFRLIGFALTPAGGITLGAIALVGAVNAMQELADADYASKFGQMKLDFDELGGYVSDLRTGFQESYKEFDAYTASVLKAVDSYKTASSDLSGDLLSKMLTGTQLTEPDKQALEKLGVEMMAQLQLGIQSASSANLTYLKNLFGGDGVADLDPIYQQISDVLNLESEDRMAGAESLGAELRDALFSAFEDDTISPEEYEQIVSLIRSINEAVAQAAAQVAQEESEISLESLLYKAQTASWDELQKYGQELENLKSEAFTKAEDAFIRDRAEVKLAYDRQIAKGEATEAERDAALASMDAKKNQMIYGDRSLQQINDAILRLYLSAIQQSDLRDPANLLGAYADTWLKGGISGKGASDIITGLFGKSAYADEQVVFGLDSTKQQLGKYLISALGSLGGMDELTNLMDYYRAQGDTEKADEYARLWAMTGIATNFNPLYGAGAFTGDVMDKYLEQYSLDTARGTIRAFDRDGTITAFLESIEAGLRQGLGYGIMDPLAYENNTLKDDQITELTNMRERLRETYDLDAILAQDANAPSGTGDLYREFYAIKQLLYGELSDTEQFRIAPLSLDVQLPDGSAAGSDFASEAQAYLSANPGSWPVHVSLTGMPKGGGGNNKLDEYAQGGRAAIPSIFGEAGPEWAIPEEHSLRTAALLDAAREASGFTWGELIGRNGGLNASPGRQAGQYVYAPTIYANDARDVEEKLLEDKERFFKWMEDSALREEAEVYV